MKLWRLPRLLAILFTGAVTGMYFQPPGLRAFYAWTGLRPGAGSANPIAVPPGALAHANVAALASAEGATVVARGRLIPSGKSVSLSTPYGSGDARIARLLVAEGERVEAGAIIAELDSLPHLRAELASMEAARVSRAAALEQTRARVATSRAETFAAVDRAREALALADRELRRIEGLATRGIVAESELDAVSSQAAQAARDRDRLAAIAERWQGGEAQPDIALARSELAVAASDVERARAELENGIVRAPRGGTVIALHVRPGERASTAGVATVGDLERMQAELEVYQTDVGSVALAQPVLIEAPGLQGALAGAVAQIGLEVERQARFSPDPAANTDARIVRVTVTLDERSSARARGLTGLEIVGRVAVGPR